MNNAPLIMQLRRVISEQLKQLEELRDGSCRFHCRTRREAFMAGFDAGMDQGVRWDGRHEAWSAWEQQKGLK